MTDLEIEKIKELIEKKAGATLFSVVAGATTTQQIIDYNRLGYGFPRFNSTAVHDDISYLESCGYVKSTPDNGIQATDSGREVFDFLVEHGYRPNTHLII